MGDALILKQLRHIIDLLNNILDKLDEINRPKSRNVAWGLFFPRGAFEGQKSQAKEAAAIMLDVQTRIDDMIKTLRKRSHPLVKQVEELNYLDFKEMGDQLIEIPQRAQYFGDQIFDYGSRIKELIKELE